MVSRGLSAQKAKSPVTGEGEGALAYPGQGSSIVTDQL